MAFDLVYFCDFPKTLNLLAKHEGDIGAFLTSLERKAKLENDDIHALMELAMAATYDPDPTAFTQPTNEPAHIEADDERDHK